MNPEISLSNAIEKANGQSSAILIERCEKSAEHPYGIKVVENILPNEILVVGLPGTVSRKESLKACNGIIKRITDFVNNEPRLKNIKVRPVMAVCDFGNYFYKETAKNIMLLEQNNRDEAYRRLGRMSCKEQEEMTMPNYVKDIYNLVLKNRLSDGSGNIRLSEVQALRNISRTIFVPYCWGGYTALKLEQYMQHKMEVLHYNPTERTHIQSQMVALNYSPSCPIGVSRSRFISISSASDLTTKHNNYAKEYLNMYVHGCPDFGYLWWDSKKGNIFYCAQFNKYGVEGNEIQYKLVKINSWDDLFHKKDDETPSLGEHDFIGFEPMELMSNAAKKLQYYANNILVNSIKHAAKQGNKGYKELPNTRMLAAKTPKDHWDLFQAYRLGLLLDIRIKDFGKENIMKYSPAANMGFVSMD